MLAGTASDGITRCVIPDQVPRRSARSVSVEVTLRGKLQLAAALQPGERYLARIHSHPHEAFHSPTDDANPGLTAEGALSIVVPDFGRGLRTGLSSCAIYELRRGCWSALTPAEVRSRLVVRG